MVTPDALALAVSMLALGALVGSAELLHRKFGWPSRVSRRLVHLGTGLFVVCIPYFFTGVGSVYLLAVTFVLVNGFAAARGWLRGMHPADHDSWGTVAFPLALLAVLPFCWRSDRQFILQTAFLVLAIADPLAATIGERYARRQIRIGAATKSVLGSVTFLAAAWLLASGGLILFGAASPPAESVWSVLVLSALVAVAATAVEALGGRGWDNFFIVAAIAAVLLIWQIHPERLPAMLIGGAVGVGFALFSWKLEYLTLSGALAGGLFATTLIGAGGWGWMAPGFTFFFLSSLLSKRAAAWKGSEVNAAGGKSRRDASQVYANGGVAWLLVIAHALTPQAWVYWGFVGSLAAATADTWATELGPLSGEQPRMILSGRRVPAGTSGAVTWAGTLAGMVGATVIGAVAWWTASDPSRTLGIGVALISVVGGGVIGSVVDSILGASVQAVYRDRQSGRTTDEPAPRKDGFERVQGWRRVNNNLVNLFCTAMGAAVTTLLVLALRN